jgi:hypothetical protein
MFFGVREGAAGNAAAPDRLCLDGKPMKQPSKFFVANFGLRNQDAAGKVFDQVCSDRAEPPSGQWSIRSMAYNDKVCLDLVGDAGDLTSGFSHAQTGGGRKAHRLQPLHTLLQYFLVGLDLFGNRDKAALERSSPASYFGHCEQKYGCVAKLGNFRSLPQGPPALDGAVIGKEHFAVQGKLPSIEQGKLDRLLVQAFWRLATYSEVFHAFAASFSLWQSRLSG